MSEFIKYLKANQHSGNCTRAEAFTMGQRSRQSEIDQLKKQLSDSDYLKEEHRKRRCDLAKEVEKLKAEKAGLERRGDLALALIDITSYSEINRRTSDFIDQIKHALRGEHE